MKKETYSLKDGSLEIQFFSEMERFKVHIKDHFCDKSKPWSRLLGQKLIDQICQKVEKGEVTPIETKDFYNKVVSKLNEGITFSVNSPLYIIIDEQTSLSNKNNFKDRKALYFIAEQGYILICDENIIKTAYFVGHNPKKDAYLVLFKKAWENIKAKCEKKEYYDNKGDIYHKILDVKKENEANWQNCPNPHFKQKKKKNSYKTKYNMESFQFDIYDEY